MPDTAMNYSDYFQEDARHYTARNPAESTLLIPEKIVWLPYAGLVFTVICWLGYDFYRFHKRTKLKQARVEEHRVVLNLSPNKHRINMISGVGLRFKKGKPVLGDVWNTSPSSSDLSSCCSHERHGRAYSREVTPSDEGGCGYSEGETFPLRNTSSYVNVAENHNHKGPQKGWEIGGEYVEGLGGSSVTNASSDASSNEGHRPSEPSQIEGQPPSYQEVKGTSVNDSQAPGFTLLTTSKADNIATDRLFRTFRAGGGVDDGGGGSSKSDTSGSQDAVTQTDFEDAYFNMTTGERINYPFKSNYHTYPPPNSSAPQWSSNAGGPTRRRESMDLSHSMVSPPYNGLANHSDPARDTPRRRLSREETLGATGKHGGKRRPSLRIDLLAAPPHSPTTELVAQDHGFALEGLEVPSFSGGSRSLPSSGSDIFKPKDSRKSSHASIKPLSPSPAVMTRLNVPHESPPPPLKQHYHHHHYHHHRHRRPDSLDFTFVNPKSHPERKHPSSSAHHHARTASSSLTPHSATDHDRRTVGPTLKVPHSAPEPRSAPIPKHMYHQDEEGFFSSSSPASHYQTGRTFASDSDGSRRGILFFSRLSGAGRVSSSGGFDSSVGSSSGAAYGAGKLGGGYKTGGFQS